MFQVTEAARTAATRARKWPGPLSQGDRVEAGPFYGSGPEPHIVGVTQLLAPPAPKVFDRPLLRRRLDRAIPVRERTSFWPVPSRDLMDRLSTVKREFRQVLDLGTPRPGPAAARDTPCPRHLLVRAAPRAEPRTKRGLVADEEALPFAPKASIWSYRCCPCRLPTTCPVPSFKFDDHSSRTVSSLAVSLEDSPSTNCARRCSWRRRNSTGGASPRVAPFSDLRDLGQLLQRTGFALPVTDVEPLVVRYSSPFGLIADLRSMGATNALVLRRASGRFAAAAPARVRHLRPRVRGPG